MAASRALECQVVRLLDADGTPLTIAMTRAEGEDGAVVLDEVDDPAVLLDYYFGRGERIVMMELPNQIPVVMIEGTLETWWIAAERVWQVYVDRPLVTLGPVGSAQPEPAAAPYPGSSASTSEYRTSGARIDQRQPGLVVVHLPQMTRRFGEDHLKRRPDGRLQDVTATRRALGRPHHDMRVNLRRAVLERHVADEREHLDLLPDRDPLVRPSALARSTRVSPR